MKRIIIAVLTIALVFSLSIPAMAQETRKEKCLDKIQITATQFVAVMAQLEEMKAIWNDEAYGDGAADAITADDVTAAGYTDITLAEFQSAMAQVYDILDNWKTAAKMAELRKVARY